jgi:hypothetical protein
MRREDRRGSTTVRETLQSARQVGDAGRPGGKATAAPSKDVIGDMFARNRQGTAPAGAVKWAAVELRKIDGV